MFLLVLSALIGGQHTPRFLSAVHLHTLGGAGLGGSGGCLRRMCITKQAVVACGRTAMSLPAVTHSTYSWHAVQLVRALLVCSTVGVGTVSAGAELLTGYCTVLYCTVLYCTGLYCSVLYFTVAQCCASRSGMPAGSSLQLEQ